MGVSLVEAISDVSRGAIRDVSDVGADVGTAAKGAVIRILRVTKEASIERLDAIRTTAGRVFRGIAAVGGDLGDAANCAVQGPVNGAKESAWRLRRQCSRCHQCSASTRRRIAPSNFTCRVGAACPRCSRCRIYCSITDGANISSIFTRRGVSPCSKEYCAVVSSTLRLALTPWRMSGVVSALRASGGSNPVST